MPWFSPDNDKEDCVAPSGLNSIRDDVTQGCTLGWYASDLRPFGVSQLEEFFKTRWCSSRTDVGFVWGLQPVPNDKDFDSGLELIQSAENSFFLLFFFLLFAEC